MVVVLINSRIIEALLFYSDKYKNNIPPVIYKRYIQIYLCNSLKMVEQFPN